MTDQERAERLRHHMYETLEGIRKQSERIARLEELAIAMWPFVSKADRMQWPELMEHMLELGLEAE